MDDAKDFLEIRDFLFVDFSDLAISAVEMADSDSTAWEGEGNHPAVCEQGELGVC